MTEAIQAESGTDPGRCIFVGFPCNNYDLFLEDRCSDCARRGSGCVLMGLGSYRFASNMSSKLFLKTSSSPPFCCEYAVLLVCAVFCFRFISAIASTKHLCCSVYRVLNRRVVANTRLLIFRSVPLQHQSRDWERLGHCHGTALPSP